MDAATLLGQIPLFAALPGSELQTLAGLAERQDLHSGQRLYEENESPDFFYVVVSGRLRVSLGPSLLGYVGRGEPVGEMGVILGEPRTSTVHALRDTVLLRVAATPFLDLLQRQGPTLMAMTRLMLGRMRQYQRSRRRASTRAQGALAILPASSSVPVQVMAEALVRRLGGWPHARLITAAHVDAALGEGAAQTAFEDVAGCLRLRSWLNQLEGRHPYLVLAAHRDDDVWAVRCLRQADRVLVLAEAGAQPDPIPALGMLPEGRLLAPVELVLLRPEGDPSPYTREWCAVLGARAHYFVHPWSDEDLSALARQITGRGVGLVLGGGGARGFAHIGLVRALHQLQIPVDVAGGTSMGAFVSAMVACGFDPVEMAYVARETFVNNNFLNDYTLPRVSLIRGRRFFNRLIDIFGERRIEELRRSYYCISTNLTSGATVVHDHGLLAAWVGTSKAAVPGVAPPVAWEGDLLCDGGVVDNLPTDVMQALERGSIIACNVSHSGDIRAPGRGQGAPEPDALLKKWLGEGLRPRFSEILLRTATLTADTLFRKDAIERADVDIHMPVQDVGMFAWRRLDELIERGYEHAMQRLAPLRDQLVAG
ncbi:MAG: cyclic nucleotide-binding protein [Panacagrimonas sp.]|nr:cyclic nucleotide-binding and patatin-like phospholipase domain-containing protein [Panacagrimonas sp.]MCC2655732.1 cyclic nucleotide-binding protein [Panacagrimonas sp.]